MLSFLSDLTLSSAQLSWAAQAEESFDKFLETSVKLWAAQYVNTSKKSPTIDKMETEMKIIQMKLANLSRFEQSWIEVFKKAPSNSTTFKELETAVDL